MNIRHLDETMEQEIRRRGATLGKSIRRPDKAKDNNIRHLDEGQCKRLPTGEEAVANRAFQAARPGHSCMARGRRADPS